MIYPCRICLRRSSGPARFYGFVIRHGLVAIIIAVVASASLLAQGNSPPPGTRNDQDAIAAVMTATTDAFSRRDAKAWVAFCTPDAHWLLSAA